MEYKITKDKLDEIMTCLTDGNVNEVDLKSDDEVFGAIMMVGHLFKKIGKIVNDIKEIEVD
ncbi:MAG TPA: hypothetical protein DCM40_39665 [Maribacter sp.]|nr:hypothetical protein [Maribacter sp.]